MKGRFFSTMSFVRRQRTRWAKTRMTALLASMICLLLAIQQLYKAMGGTQVVYLNAQGDRERNRRNGSVTIPARIDDSANRLPPLLLAPQGVRFVFFVGLEGSGHDRLKQYLRESPTSITLNQLGVREALRDLQDALYSNAGLFFLHCRLRGYQSEIQWNSTSHSQLNRLRSGGVTPERLEYVSVEHAFRRAVALLQNLAHSLHGRSVNVPLNADGYIASAASYPQDRDSCRRSKHPNLDLLFYACQEAGVDCRHVYLHRDVKDLLTSVDPPKLSTIHLYTTLLNVMFAQLAKYPSKVLACLDVCDPSQDHVLRGVVGDLFGVPEKSGKAAASDSRWGCVTAEQTSSPPLENHVYLESMDAAARRAQSLCHRLVRDLSR